MKRTIVTLVMAAAICTAAIPRAHAWGKIGHRVTGVIAERYLTQEARAQVAAILGVEDLAEASTWADFMRSSPDEFWRKTASPWHYVTIPAGKTYDEVGAPPQGDAITGLAELRRTLLDDDASLADRQSALRFIVHIIGDLQQPLHAGNGTDRGGNDYKVTFFGKTTNLHSVWDTDLVRDEELSYSELAQWLMRRLTPAQIVGWSQADPVVWVTESAAIRDRIYPGGDREIRWPYIYEHRGTVRMRLSQGGIRIAAYLNEMFDASGQ